MPQHPYMLHHSPKPTLGHVKRAESYLTKPTTSGWCLLWLIRVCASLCYLLDLLNNALVDARWCIGAGIYRRAADNT